MSPTRCAWADSRPLLTTYHDTEWGVPAHDDTHLFEMLILEGAQAGLAWLTILQRRDGYRDAFHRFDVDRIAGYTDADVARLLADERIIRNRAKIRAAIGNAQAVQTLRREGDTLDAVLWSFAPEARPAAPTTAAEVPAQTAESAAMSRALKKRGFRFVGPTICYAFMQAVGIVNDHAAGCFRRNQV